MDKVFRSVFNYSVFFFLFVNWKDKKENIVFVHFHIEKKRAE